VDGYLAGPNGEIDWIVHDPTVDFRAVYAQFDTVLLGRRTYELTQQPGAPPWPTGWRVYVFSRTLEPAEHPAVTVVGADIESTVASLREEHGRDIWLFGGGKLFASLLALQLVDEVELAVMPVLLGGGIPLAGTAALRSRLRLTRSDALPSGIVNLQYDIHHATG
jgi:dihydrofolate reductase